MSSAPLANGQSRPVPRCRTTVIDLHARDGSEERAKDEGPEGGCSLQPTRPIRRDSSLVRAHPSTGGMGYYGGAVVANGGTSGPGELSAGPRGATTRSPPSPSSRHALHPDARQQQTKRLPTHRSGSGHERARFDHQDNSPPNLDPWWWVLTLFIVPLARLLVISSYQHVSPLSDPWPGTFSGFRGQSAAAKRSCFKDPCERGLAYVSLLPVLWAFFEAGPWTGKAVAGVGDQNRVSSLTNTLCCSQTFELR